VFKKAVVLSIILLLLLPAAAARANDVVVLKSADIKPYDDALDGFRSSCGCSVREVDLGRTGNGDISKKLSEIDPDMVLAIGMDALTRVQAVTDLTVIYTMVLPSEFHGPLRKNISGVSMYISPEKFLGMMAEILPGAKRIGIIYDPRYSEAFVREAMRAAEQRGVQLVLKKADRSSDVPPLIDAMRGKIDAFWMLPDLTVINPETVKYLLLFSFRNKVPVITFSNKYVQMGALAALNIAPFDIGVQAGEMAKKFSNGGKDKMPVRAEARKAVLTINRTVATKLGIRIRDDILKRADDVY
jgi:putative ABC transport system substrate-binding protein